MTLHRFVYSHENKGDIFFGVCPAVGNIWTPTFSFWYFILYMIRVMDGQIKRIELLLVL